MYFKGANNLSPDMERAQYWYGLSAQKGNRRAKECLQKIQEKELSASNVITEATSSYSGPAKKFVVKSEDSQNSGEPGDYFTYTVKSGDTLFLISKHNNVRQSAILKANPGIKFDRLRIGQKIRIPKHPD